MYNVLKASVMKETESGDYVNVQCVNSISQGQIEQTSTTIYRFDTSNMSTENVDALFELYVKVPMMNVKTPTIYNTGANCPIGTKITFLQMMAKENAYELTHYFYKLPTLQQMQQLNDDEIITPMRFSISNHILETAVKFVETNKDHARVIHFITGSGIIDGDFDLETVPFGQAPLHHGLNELLETAGFDIEDDPVRSIPTWSSQELHIDMRYTYCLDMDNTTIFMDL